MKGITLAQFGSLALAFIMVAIILSMGGEILYQMKQSQCTWNATTLDCVTSTVASNITQQGLEGNTTFGEWLPTIAVVLAAAVVIGVIVHYFRG